MTTAAEQKPREYRAGEASPPVVLIVDDVPDNLLALEGILRRDDIEVMTADSGRTALEILLERDVAVAIVDVQMPEMDGFELVALMRGVEKTRYVPVILVTAGSRDQARVFRGYEAGAVDYLFKPIDEQVLRGKVDVFVTLEKNRRELCEVDRMREMFIAVLGHDLRNPLSGILMAAGLIRDGHPSADVRAFVEGIARNAHRMRRLIEQLLDATRFRADGAVALSPEPADLEELTNQILKESGRDAERFRLDVRGDVAGTWDIDRMLQVLANLIGNAVKHSPQGSPIRISIDGRDADTVVLCVHNEGPPIPKELRGVLFEPFRRSAPGTRAGDGLGLGLYITKQLVHAHGGGVSFDSNEDTGTEFAMSLPRHAATLGARASEPIGSAEQRAADEAAYGESTVLLVEDEPVARLGLTEMLRQRGHCVLSAASPKQAFEAAAKHRGAIDVLLTDLRLPEMDGAKLAEQLCDSRPEMRVIFMSGSPNPLPPLAAFVQKPIDPDALIRLLEA